MRLFRKLAYCLVAVVPLAALASCAAGQASDPPLEQQSITVEAVPTADEAGLYIAADEGLFRQQGLNVTIKPTTGGEDTLPDLNSDRAQIVGGNYVSFVQFQAAHQANLRIIAGGSLMQQGNQALYVLPNSQYHSVADLAANHATIGVNTLNNVGTLLISALMTSQGSSIDHVHLKAPPGGFPEEMTLLQEGQLGAAWLPEPFATEAEQKFGAVPLADLNQGPLTAFPIGCYVGSAAWVGSHPSTVAAFLRALKQGQQIANDNRPALQLAMQKYLGVSSYIADSMTFDNYPSSLSASQMQRVANEMFLTHVMLPGSSTAAPYHIARMVESDSMTSGGTAGS